MQLIPGKSKQFPLLVPVYRFQRLGVFAIKNTLQHNTFYSCLSLFTEKKKPPVMYKSACIYKIEYHLYVKSYEKQKSVTFSAYAET